MCNTTRHWGEGCDDELVRTCAHTIYVNISWSSHSTLLQGDWELHLRYTLNENYWNTLDFLTPNSLSLSSYKQFSYLQDWTVGCFSFPCRPHVPATSVRDEGQMLHVPNNLWAYTRKCCIKISKNISLAIIIIIIQNYYIAFFFCMGVKLGHSHWGRNVWWGCWKTGCCKEYLSQRGTR
jgi:hypothetical protein